MSQLIDEAQQLDKDATLLAFVRGDYRASRYFFRQIDQLQLLTLACVVLFFFDARGMIEVIISFSLYAVAIGGHLSLQLGLDPFSKKDRWKHRVRLSASVLSIVAAVLNLLT